VVAGNETTRNAISHGMKALTDFPAERAKWVADFDGMAPTAVEEIVRWATPVIHFRRSATRDVEVGGETIRAGDKVVLWYTSANRDEAAFPDPYRFDVGRTPNDHVGFGAGGVDRVVRPGRDARLSRGRDGARPAALLRVDRGPSPSAADRQGVHAPRRALVRPGHPRRRRGTSRRGVRDARHRLRPPGPA